MSNEINRHRRDQIISKCKCGKALWSNTEQEFKACNACLDDMAERERERREFLYYHPD